MIDSADNIMKAIRLLDLEAQAYTEVKTADLITLVVEIEAERRVSNQLSRELYRAEVRASNAIAEGLKIMSEATPKLDVRG